MELYNYRFVYLTPYNNKKYIKTNDNSIPLERAWQEVHELYNGADEINATILEVKIIKVSV